MHKVYFFIESDSTQAAQEALTLTSGSFSIGDLRTTDGDHIIGIQTNVPNFSLFEQTVAPFSEKYENATLEDVLADKSKTLLAPPEQL